MSNNEKTIVCPLCQAQVSSIGGGDALQLHYLTNCSGYDKVSSETPRPKPTTQTGSSASSTYYSNAMGSSVGPPSSSATAGALYHTTGAEASAAAGGSTLVGETLGASGGGTSDDGTSSVQFMWQPLSDISYPSITLLASFKGGSVNLSIDPDGGHYASQFTSIPKGTYEGQLVIGDSFMHPVKKFTIEKDDDIVVLQFEVGGPSERATGDLDGGYGGSYGSGHMQKNPSYNQAPSHGSSYSYQNPAFGHGTSSGQSSYGGESSRSNYGYSAHGQPTLDTASDTHTRGHYSKTPPTYLSSSMKSRSAEFPLSDTPNVSQSRVLTNDINISLASNPTSQPSGQESVARAKDKDSGFNVRHLQRERSEGGQEQQLHEVQAQLETVIREKNALMQGQERVNAQWEGRVRRLERQLNAFQAGDKPDESDVEASLRDARNTIADLERQVAALRRQKNEDSQSAKDSREMRKQLDEMKDRNTALEQQMLEYGNTIQDQAKVIQSLKGSGATGEVAVLQQLLHKQQVEYSEAINSFHKKIDFADKVAQDNREVNQMNVKLAGELEDYRSQTKIFIQDMKQKDEEIMALKQALARRPSGNSEALSLELATMKQKLSAWQEEVEKLTPLQEDMEQLQDEFIQVQSANEVLQQQVQQLEDDLEKTQHELVEKVDNYNTLSGRFAELQQTRVNLENELQPLREERAKVLRENAHLLEGSDPKKYATLKKEHETLLTHSKQLELALEEQSSLLSAHQESNVEMQQQLDKATDPERLQSIRTRMERYKQERDVARNRIEEVEKQVVMYQSEQETLMKQMQEVSNQAEIRLQELHLQMNQQEKSLVKSADFETRMRRYRDERNKASSDNRRLRQQLETLEQAMSDLLAQTGQQDTSEYLQSLTGEFETMELDVGGMEHSSEQETHRKDVLAASPTGDDYQPQHYSTDEDQHEFSSHGENHQPPVEQEPWLQHGGLRSDGEQSQSSESKGSLERSKVNTRTVTVHTKEGIIHVKIRKPHTPLNPKDKPPVIVKKGNDYEAGTLTYIGTHSGKEVAGIQMSIRQQRSSASTASASLSDGTYKDGKRYFKCPVGFGLYVPLSKVFVRDDVI